jgi:uncharacterized membrane protein YbhN (UPF0104 family)
MFFTHNNKFIKSTLLVMQCVIGLFLLWWISSSMHLDGSALVQQLTQTEVAPLLLGTLCFILAIVLGALRYHLFLPTSVPLKYLIGTTLLQNTLLTFVPWRMGEVSYPLLLRRDFNIPLLKSSAVILAIRLVDLFVVLTIALLGAVRFGIDTRLILFVGIGAIAFCCAGVLIVGKWEHKAPAFIITIRSGLTPLANLRYLLAFLALSISIFIVTTLQSIFILQSVSLYVNILDLALLNALTLLVSLLPIHPPGGWGTTDSLQVVILARLGYNSKTVLIAILAAHSLYTLVILFGGVIGWMLRERNLRSLRSSI